LPGRLLGSGQRLAGAGQGQVGRPPGVAGLLSRAAAQARLGAGA